ncbi:MAG: hypothetical protein Homavirus50_1, partial [Homavirus sp.]
DRPHYVKPFMNLAVAHNEPIFNHIMISITWAAIGI